MKIVVLENRPLIMRKVLEFFLQKESITEIFMAFYMETQDDAPPQYHYEQINTMFNELHTLYQKEATWKVVTRETLAIELNQYCKETLFIFDVILNSRWTGHMSTWPNIVYAMNCDHKIWFYTTGPESIVQFINTTFKGKNIPVLNFDVEQQQLYLDFEFINQKVLHEETEHRE